MDKELHPIDQIIEERCPKLMRNKFFWSLVRPTIYKVFKYQKAKNITDDISNESGYGCFEYLTNLLNFNLEIRESVIIDLREWQRETETAPDFIYSNIYKFKYLYKNKVPITYKKIPKNLCNFALSILLDLLAPTLAINIVIGINIKKAGTLIKPILRGKLAFKYDPVKKKPSPPNKAIINPIAEALPIALFIG